MFYVYDPNSKIHASLFTDDGIHSSIIIYQSGSTEGDDLLANG